VLFFARFLCAHNLGHYLPLPTEAALCVYVAFLARTCTAATVRTYLKGLRHFYACLAVPVPWPEFGHLRRHLEGLRRLRGEATCRKLPVGPLMLLHFARVLPAGDRWLAAFVCCVIGVFGMLRRSNLVVGGLSLFGQAKHITRGDVTVDPARYALCIAVRFSKTLQHQNRVHTVWIQGDPRPSAPLDPVRLWEGYVARAPAPATAPAFCFPEGAGVSPLTYGDLAACIKTLVRLVGLDPSQYSTHSLRRGGATAAFQAGASPFAIKDAGDWRGATFEIYLSLSPGDKLRCTQLMLAALRG
jgi:hypothetical protein